VVTLDDRCPHRRAPLSLGKVHDNDIACAYHGIRFGADGGCTLIPTQDTIHSVARVHRYPVNEAGPFVWVWTGDPALAAAAPPPPALDWLRTGAQPARPEAAMSCPGWHHWA
jgi:phenylpropionate dioxygenase-like ring-hydroxylating dioxygenase large terminal subunit